MSIELPKYSIQVAENKPSLFKKTLPVFTLILGLAIGFSGYKFWSDNSTKNLIESNRVLEELKIKNQKKIETLAIEVSQLRAENKIKNEAVLLLQNDYKSQIDTQNDLESEIQFYQLLLTPGSENQGLRVFDSKATDLGDDNYKLSLTLVQKIQKAAIISGRFEVSLLGTQGDGENSIDIHTKDDSNYEFKYFHKVSLGFSLPKGFKPTQLVVKLFPKNKKSKPIEHTVSWETLLK